MNPVFLLLCLIMFGVFYQKGFRFFQALGHAKWRCHLAGALIGLLVGFAFPLAVIVYAPGGSKPAAPAAAIEGAQTPEQGGQQTETKPEPVAIPE